LWSYEDDPAFAAHEFLKLLRQVRQLLPRITCPVLLVHSTGDTAIHPASARRTYERIGSAGKELVTLHDSGHCITVDSEWEGVAEKTWEFIDTHR
jgi:carboxylesterase